MFSTAAIGKIYGSILVKPKSKLCKVNGDWAEPCNPPCSQNIFS